MKEEGKSFNTFETYQKSFRIPAIKGTSEVDKKREAVIYASKYFAKIYPD
jgi:hypothetical protein